MVFSFFAIVSSFSSSTFAFFVFFAAPSCSSVGCGFGENFPNVSPNSEFNSSSFSGTAVLSSSSSSFSFFSSERARFLAPTSPPSSSSSFFSSKRCVSNLNNNSAFNPSTDKPNETKTFLSCATVSFLLADSVSGTFSDVGFLLFFGGIFLLYIVCLLSSECVRCLKSKSVWGNV